jgi:Domain of unknown function (DUF4157)
MAARELIRRRVRAPSPAVRRLASPGVTAARGRARERMQGAGGLMIGGVHDPAERAADRLAARVMRMPEPAGVLRRECAGCAGADQRVQRQVADEEEEPVRMKAAATAIAPGGTSAPAPAAAKAAVGGLGAGRPLSHPERAFFEPRFGADFSRVRVHDDAAAARAAQTLDARAFTWGADITYAAGERPWVGRLTAHELAHVVQNSDTMGRDVARRAPPAPPPPAGPAPPAARVVSPVWNVQGRAVVVVESGGQRLAFYQRSGGSTRPAGHAGPQLGEWAPFDGFKIRTDGQGHFVKAPYHSGIDPTHELHGFGNARNKQISAWLGRQQLQRPPERPWPEVQIELQRLGVRVSHPLPTQGRGVSPRPAPARPTPARPAPAPPAPARPTPAHPIPAPPTPARPAPARPTPAHPIPAPPAPARPAPARPTPARPAPLPPAPGRAPGSSTTTAPPETASPTAPAAKAGPEPKLIDVRARGVRILGGIRGSGLRGAAVAVIAAVILARLQAWLTEKMLERKVKDGLERVEPEVKGKLQELRSAIADLQLKLDEGERVFANIFTEIHFIKMSLGHRRPSYTDVEVMLKRVEITTRDLKLDEQETKRARRIVRQITSIEVMVYSREELELFKELYIEYISYKRKVMEDPLNEAASEGIRRAREKIVATFGNDVWIFRY